MMSESTDHRKKSALTRRLFLQSLGTMGALAAFNPLALPAGSFEDNFLSPPDSARMWTWWFWLSDRVDKKSITADLEAMKAQGIGGATVYSLSDPGLDKALRGPNYMSPAWRELFHHTVNEARRLRLGVNAMLCSGWDAGGPWITPQLACKQHTHSELTLTGPQHFRGKLPHPDSDPRFYSDISIQAFRVTSHPPAVPPDAAKVKARNALLALKNGTDSLGKSYQHPIQEICDAPLAPLPAELDGDILDPGTRIDLIAHLQADGTLDWEVPEGKWVVHRLGCTLTGVRTSRSSPTGEGLESDPLDPAGIESQFQHVAAPLLKDVGPAAGSIFRAVEIDSWEIVLPNWTMKFLDAFRRYRGYDARPYLPALAGRTVGSAGISDRFLYDYRQTLGDMVAENYFGRLTELTHGGGIIQQSEAGGICYPKVMPMDALKNLGRCDIPMGEFWQSPAWKEKNEQNINGKQTACAAHLYGKGIASGEAFASNWHWTQSPAMLKPTGDIAFCEGFNQFVIYSSATHSGDGVPGTEFAGGTHFNRKVTWWKMARPFCDYVARCSHLLRQGLFVADVLFYNGDDCPNFIPPKHVDPGLGFGYDYDVCNTEILLTRLSVRDGRIVLPDGMGYRLMVLPARSYMPLGVLRKLKELVAAGMTLIGPKPERTPGLENYPVCDRQLQAEAGELWGNCDGRSVKEHAFGKGKVVWGVTPREILARGGVGPDFMHGGGPETFIDWIHRSEASREIYFVINRKDRPESLTCAFRVRGRQPKLLDPVTGTLRDARAFTQSAETTSLPLEFAPFGSIFVIFEGRIPATQNGAGRTNQLGLAPVATLAGSWTVHFDPKWGGPASVRFPKLVDWTTSPEKGIKYYSGTATYSKTLRLKARRGRRLFLDLGEVKDVAEVRLNGQKMGIAWTRPFRLEITAAARTGANRLEIDVVNLWPNRLIGDSLLPPGKRYTQTNIDIYYQRKIDKLLPSGLLGPVTVLAS